jgi:hypothetical protein
MEIRSKEALERCGSMWSVIVHRRGGTMELPGLLSPNTREGESPWRFTVFNHERTRGFGHIQLLSKRLEPEHATQVREILRGDVPDISDVELRALTLMHLVRAAQHHVPAGPVDIAR